jgi:WD40 repeat protein
MRIPNLLLFTFFLCACTTIAPLATSAPSAEPTVTPLAPTVTQTIIALTPTVTVLPRPTVMATLPPSATPTLTPVSARFTQLVQLGRGLVKQMALSPNAQWLAVLGSDEMRVYAADTLKLQKTLVKASSILHLTWSADSQKIAFNDATAVEVVAVDTGAVEHTWPIEAGSQVYEEAWSPDGARLAVLASDPTNKYNNIVRVWNSDTGKETFRFFNSLAHLVWSPDGTRLAGYYDWTAGTLNLADGKLWSISYDGTGAITSVAWSPDGKQLAVGFGGLEHSSALPDLKVRVWVGTDGSQQPRLKFEADTPVPVSDVAWSSDGRTLAVGLVDGTVQLLDPDAGQLQDTLANKLAGIASLAWLPDDVHLLVAGTDGTVREWDITQKRAILELGDAQAYPPLAYQVSWSPRGDQIALVGSTGTIQLWDTKSWKLVRALADQGNVAISVSWSPDGSLLASTGYDGYVRIWEPMSGKVLKKLLRIANSQGYWGQVAWENNAGRYLVVASDSLEIWDTTDWQPVDASPHEKLATTAVAWSPNGQYLAIGVDEDSGPHRLYWLDAHSWKMSVRDKLFGYTIDRLTWSPDGTRIILGLSSGDFQVWDFASTTATLQLSSPSVKGDAVSWSPNGQWWALGGFAGGVQVWNAQSEQLWQDLGGHTDIVNSLAWSPDSTELISSSNDGTIRVWGIANP